MKKRSIIFVFILSLAVFVGFGIQEAEAESVTKIYTIEDLYNVNNDMSGNYVLMNDIDMSATKNDGEWAGWKPLGYKSDGSTVEFTGTFDGAGYFIKNLEISTESTVKKETSNVGLFGINSGTVKNLIMDSSCSISGDHYNGYLCCGSIAGVNNGTITNCLNRAEVRGHVSNNSSSGVSTLSGQLGGIAGSSSGTIDHCGNEAYVYGYANIDTTVNNSVSYNIGGIVGEGGAVSYSYNTGEIKGYNGTRGTYYATYGIGGTASYCYNTGAVKGSGITNGTATSCYNCGTGASGAVASTCNNCFALTGTGNASSGVTFLSEEQMKKEMCFSGFDFDSVWVIDPDSEYLYPQLRNNRQDNNDIDAIDMLAAPSTISYWTGDEIDLSGAKLVVYYKDDTSKQVTPTKNMISGYDMQSVGVQTVNVDYREFKTSFEISVLQRPDLVSLTLISGPEKTEFAKGSSFDFTGAQAVAVYSDATRKTIDLTPENTEGGNINSLGDQTITFSLDGKSVEFQIKVVPVKVTGIKVTAMPKNTSYVEGMTPNYDGLEITAEYNNGTESLVTDYELSEAPITVGTHTITVTYLGHETSFEVKAVPKTAIKLTVTSNPTKTNYVIGQQFDPAGMTVQATFDNGDIEDVSDYTVSAMPSTVGSALLTIEYDGVKAYVTVHIVEKALVNISVVPPTKVNYIEEEDFDASGMVVTALYNDQETVELTNDEYTLSGINMKKIGTNTVTVLYEGETATFEITITKKTLTKIEVTPPDKTEYIAGDAFDDTGMAVKAFYDNGKSEVVTDYELSGFGESEESNIITVSYGGKSKAFEVIIHTPESEWNVTTPPACTTDGEKVLQCKNCYVVLKTETVKATGHTWSNWEPVSSPTCVDKGSEKRTCSVCSLTETRDVDANGHTWEDSPRIDKPASCSEEGSQSIHCKNCDQVKDSTIIPKLDHVYGEWNIVRVATCTETGEKNRVCSECGNVDTVIEPALNHSWNAPIYTWSDDKTEVTATRSCANDAAHQETETVKTTSKITKAATYTAKGETTYTANFENVAFETQTMVEADIPVLTKKNNTMTVKPVKKTVKVKKLKKKALRIAPLKVTNAKGTVTYKITGGTKKSKKALKINTKTGKVTVKKGTKKGTYKVRVTVKAAGTKEYKPLSKTVTITVKAK